MKTLIAYSSKHGCTETCTRLLAERLVGEVERVNLKDTSEVNLSAYDAVVVGSPVYAGRILGEVRTFTEEHLDALMEKTGTVYLWDAGRAHY